MVRSESISANKGSNITKQQYINFGATLLISLIASFVMSYYNRSTAESDTTKQRLQKVEIEKADYIYVDKRDDYVLKKQENDKTEVMNAIKDLRISIETDRREQTKEILQFLSAKR